jgi:glycosyltransferase involved in cell wall biosynthesis
MRLLIVTQAVDTSDTTLGFFTEWLSEFAKRFESLTVVCLKKGPYHASLNVRVHSLGKERRVSRIAYLLRFYAYAWRLRREYDAVLVHMNQEYVLLGGLLWKALGKTVYLWRNHYAGSFLTRIAGMLSKKVFYTSKFSYTARFPNAVRMPVGVDTSRFALRGGERTPRSVLFFARFAPSKHPELLLTALQALEREGVPFSASFYGSALPADESFRARLAREAGNVARFYEGVPHADAPAIFAAHDIFVDPSASGMYNKTIFEAAASGCLVLAASRDLAKEVDARFTFAEDGSDLASKLRVLLELPENEKSRARAHMRSLAENHSLATLAARLTAELSL